MYERAKTITLFCFQINKRIQSFMERKREQVNISNVKDFCIREEENEMCARVDAVLLRRKDAISHIQGDNIISDLISRHLV